MMHFKEMPYERVCYEELEGRYHQLMEELREAGDAEACMAVLRKRYELMADMTAMDLCYVRHDMDVNDAFYAAEQVTRHIMTKSGRSSATFPTSSTGCSWIRPIAKTWRRSWAPMCSPSWRPGRAGSTAA